MALVALIRPPVLVSRWNQTSSICPPIGLAYLAATLRDGGHQVAVVDAVGEAPSRCRPIGNRRFLTYGLATDEIIARIPRDVDVVGISCMFSHEWPRVRGLIQSIKAQRPHIPTIAGGEHVSAAPEFCLSDCPELDLCVVGEGEETLLEVVNVHEAGGEVSSISGIAFRVDSDRVERTPRRLRIRAVDEIPPPAWDLVPLENYLTSGNGNGVNRGRSIPVLASRGCPYECTFCSSPNMWTTRWIARAPDRLLEEMRGYLDEYRVQNFDFHDLTAIVSRGWTIRFCQGIIDSGLQFSWQLPEGTRSEALDTTVLRLLYRSGCRNISYAPESGSPAVLQRIKKRVDLQRIKASMREAVRAGLNVHVHIVIGFPDESHTEVWKTLKFMCRMAVIGVHDVGVSIFAPYPGSELFEQLRERGKVPRLTDDYFHSLAAMSDLFRGVSFCEAMSGFTLVLYRLVGLFLFYSLSFISRPWRLPRNLLNVIRRTQESRLETALRNILVRNEALTVGERLG